MSVLTSCMCSGVIYTFLGIHMWQWKWSERHNLRWELTIFYCRSHFQLNEDKSEYDMNWFEWSSRPEELSQAINTCECKTELICSYESCICKSNGLDDMYDASIGKQISTMHIYIYIWYISHDYLIKKINRHNIIIPDKVHTVSK